MAGRARRTGGHRYPRSARVGETLREIIAEELVRIDDDRLSLVTITGIDVDDELNRAHVFFDSLAGEDGDAEVREIFRVPRIGAIAGCYVQNGTITRGSKVRFLRDGTIIWKGSVTSLRRFKEDVHEVRAGFECGIGLSDFQDLKPGDVIETFEERELERKLS